MPRPVLSFLAPRPVAAPALAPRLLPQGDGPDADLIARVGAEACLRYKILPWRRSGDGILVIAENAQALARAAEVLVPLGRIYLHPVGPDLIRVALLQHLRGPLIDHAEAAPPAHLSARTLRRVRPDGMIGTLLPIAATLLFFAAVLAPQILMLSLLSIMAFSLFVTTTFRLCALIASRAPHTLPLQTIEPVQWPVISILVPLLREGPMVGALITRLSDLDYPRDRYDLLLIVEEDDLQTVDALAQVTLPQHARVITVPKGGLQTKPRALNYALPFARGTIVGIYDAEDRPAPDQLRRVAAQFAHAPPEVICLQGRLDFYNDRSNWMARCFTLEYCAWFRVILPGLARLGLPVPLGGTTLFLRRHAIDALGGWDAHNVTEDADLGIRIARMGYRTEMIPTVTEEEANARPWPWVKQRTRWFKGYAVTWAVHMRNPRALLRDLGWRGFIGLQITLLGALMTFLGAPILWAYGVIALTGFKLLPIMPLWGIVGFSLLFLVSFLIDMAAQIAGVWRAGKDHLILWAPTTYAYFPLATIAAWRAVVQALTDPFTWEKTEHGIYAPLTTAPPPVPAARQASVG